MEILVELLVGFLQIVFELGLQLFFEIFAELGLHSMREPFQPRKRINPWLAALGYALFGAIAGAMSLAIHATSFIESELLQRANLLITPVLAGLVMMWVGSWRRRRGQDVVRLDRFFYGFLFALAFGAVRYAYTH